MDIDLQALIDKITNMAEASNKARGIDNFGSVGFKNQQERAYTDSRNDARDKLIADKEKTRDIISAQREQNNLAHPETMLSSQDRYLQYLNDIKHKRAMEPGAITNQEAQAAYHYGLGAQGAGVGAKNEAEAITQNKLTEQLSGSQLANMFAKIPVNTGITNTVATPVLNSITQPASNNDTLAPLNANPSLSQNGNIATPNPSTASTFQTWPLNSSILSLPNLSGLANYIDTGSSLKKKSLFNLPATQ